MDQNTEKKLATLRSSISEPEDIPVFDEIVICFKAGAYRSSYIMTWLGIAESLRNKFTVIAIRDSSVERFLRSLEEQEKKQNSTDGQILDGALKWGLINSDEKKKLEHIQDMRNIYAHPKRSAPTPEETLAAIVVGSDSVFKRPPLLREGYVSETINNLFGYRHFLEDDQTKIEEYATSFVVRINPEVQPFLLKKLLEAIEKIIDDPELTIFRKRGIIFTTAFLTSSKVKLDDKWDIVKLIQTYPNSCSVLFSDSKLWPNLSEQAQNMIFGQLTEPTIEGRVIEPFSLGLKRANELLIANLLDDKQIVQFKRALDRASYSTIERAEMQFKYYINKIIEDLGSTSFDVQNGASLAFYRAGPEKCMEVDTKSQEQLGRSLVEAATHGAWSAQRVLGNLLEKGNLWPETFIKGILTSPFIYDGNKFWFESTYVKTAMKIALLHQDSGQIYNEVASTINNSEPRFTSSSFDFGGEKITIENLASVNRYDKAIERLTQICSEAELDNAKINVLLESIKGAKSNLGGFLDK